MLGTAALFATPRANTTHKLLLHLRLSHLVLQDYPLGAHAKGWIRPLLFTATACQHTTHSYT